MSSTSSGRQKDQFGWTVRQVLGLLREFLNDPPADSIEVPGDAPVAERLRNTLGAAATNKRLSRPVAVVDTSGEATFLLEALDRLDTEGVLVLASQEPASSVHSNVYQDLHRRSLNVVAVPSPGDSSFRAGQR